MARTIPAIPEPSLTPEGLRDSLGAMKEAIETLGGSRGVVNKANAAVTWQDLVDLGLIHPTQIPRK